jgi:hypothetical protein
MSSSWDNLDVEAPDRHLPSFRTDRSRKNLADADPGKTQI